MWCHDLRGSKIQKADNSYMALISVVVSRDYFSRIKHKTEAYYATEMVVLFYLIFFI